MIINAIKCILYSSFLNNFYIYTNVFSRLKKKNVQLAAVKKNIEDIPY